MKFRLLLALAMIFGTMSKATAQTQSAPPACGAKIEGAGTPLKFASPLPEEHAVLLRTLQVDLLATPELRERAQALLVARRYLSGV